MKRIPQLLLLLFMLFPLHLVAQGKRQQVWVIDAGHGGHDQGTKGKKVTEKEINLKVSQEVVRLIRQHKPGISVITTRKTDKFVSLPERCRIANRAGASLFLSIHVNWARKKTLRGTETFYATSNKSLRRNKNATQAELLSRLLQNSFSAAGRPIYRGVRTNRKYVTVNTNMPSALTEIAFISNAQDEAYITTDKGQKETARMIFNALMEYYATTQAGTQMKTLATLRSSGDKRSGVKNATRLTVNTGGKVAAEEPIAAEEEEPRKPAPKKAQPSTVSADGILTEDDIPAPADAPATAKLPAAPADAEPDVEPEETAEEAESQPELPVYSIQILTSPRALKSTDKRMKGLKPVTFVKDGNIYRGLYGGTTDYQQVRQTLKKVKTSFPDAFLVAHLAGKSITTAEALKITRGNADKPYSTPSASTKKAPAKKTTAPSASTKKAPAKKTTTPSASTKKAPAKKTTTPSASTKKAPAKKTTAPSASTKKAPAKKTTTPSASTKKAPAKKSSTSKKATSTKKASTTQKAPAKKR